MFQEDLALNNLQWLICHKNSIKPNQTKQKPRILFYPEALNSTRENNPNAPRQSRKTSTNMALGGKTVMHENGILVAE